MLRLLYELRGFTMYEKYVIVMIIAHWMDRYLEIQRDIDWADEQIKRIKTT
jgi:cytochrome b subunit of formate dehydrogenase